MEARVLRGIMVEAEERRGGAEIVGSGEDGAWVLVR